MAKKRDLSDVRGRFFGQSGISSRELTFRGQLHVTRTATLTEISLFRRCGTRRGHVTGPADNAFERIEHAWLLSGYHEPFPNGIRRSNHHFRRPRQHSVPGQSSLFAAKHGNGCGLRKCGREICESSGSLDGKSQEYLTSPRRQRPRCPFQKAKSRFPSRLAIERISGLPCPSCGILLRTTSVLFRKGDLCAERY